MTTNKNGNSQARTLVIYFSRTGQTRAVAQQLASLTKATVFELETKQSLPTDMYAVADWATQQYENQQFPALRQLPAIDGFDRILIGSPIWSGRLATPVVSLLQSSNFQQQQVGVFATSVGQYGQFEHDVVTFVKAQRSLPALLLDGAQVTDDLLNGWLTQK